MNLQAVLATPFQATRHPQWLSMRRYWWLSLVSLVLAALGCAGVLALASSTQQGQWWFSHQSQWWLTATLIYCCGLAFPWALHMPRLLQVSIDARRLRLPGIQKTVVASLLCYGALGVAIPVLILAPHGGNAAMIALLAALTIAGALAIVLVPVYLYLLLWLPALLTAGLGRLLHISIPAHPNLVSWGTGTLIVLLLVDIIRWRKLSHAEPNHELGIRSSLVMQFGRLGATGKWSGADLLDSALIRQIPDRFQAQADLHNADPAHPARAIRIAIGRGVMPVILGSQLRQWSYAGVTLVFAGIVFLGNGLFSAHDANPLFHSSWFWLLLYGTMAVGASGSRITVVQRRWAGVNAELPLLALLPGLGTPVELKRHALHAILLQPLSWLLGALLACWVILAAVHAPIASGAYALLVVLGSAGLLGASVLGSLGGRPLGGFAFGTLFVTLLVLVGLTPGLGDLSRVFHVDSVPVAATLRRLFAAFWVVWLLVTGALAWHGWRGLQRRPHPFMANSP